MKILKRSIKTSLLALILMLTMSASILFVFPIVDAHDPPWIRPTYTYVAVNPPTIGVGQEVLIVFWSNLIPPTARGELGEWYDFSVYITDPDGTKETFGPIKSDPVGGGYLTYTPSKLGTYTVVAYNPGIKKLTGQPGNTANVNVNDTVLPAESPPTYFTAQENQIPKYKEAPLPTDYWTRPIYGTNREWYQVAANWLGSAAQVNGPTTSFAFGTGPESAHVLWSRPLWAGGIIDSRFNDISFETSHYEGINYSPLILNGVLYYNVGSHPRFGWYAVDMYTGETLYWRNTTGSYAGRGGGFDAYGAITGEAVNYAQILDIENPNQHGGFPYLWSTTIPDKPNTWRLWDAYTRNMLCDVANVSTSGTQFRDEIGSICYLNFVNRGTATNPNYYMQVWNTTEAIWFRSIYGSYPPRSPTWEKTEGISNTYWMWRPYPNATFDGNNGFSMNVSVASILGPRNSVLNETGSIREVRPGEYVVVGTAGVNDDRGVVQGFLRAYSLKRPEWGKILWETTFTPPKSDTSDVAMTYEGGTQGVKVDPEDGVFFFWEPTTNKMFAYSIDTGQQIWERKFEEQFSYYELRSGIGGFIYNGKFYTTGYTGMMHAIDVKTGVESWNWSAPDEGLGETWYPYSPTNLGCIADGKVYLYTSEHSPSQPLRRDANIWCVNLETGKLVWKMAAWGSGLAIADGLFTQFDHFDNQIYCFGKGPSATTVTASPEVSVYGSSVLIKGTVTDQSPSGRHNVNSGLDFTLKGTPAIADEDMEGWMEYMFHDATKPENAKGVPVSLDTIDPNGNYVHIGNATSDLYGNYALSYSPEVPGTYQIIAHFAGSNSYGPSSQSTYLTVSEAYTSPTEPPTIATSNTEMYIIGVGVAIIVAIVIVGVAIVLLLRKRP